MSTRVVTSLILHPNGEPWKGGIVRFRLVDDSFTTTPDETIPTDTVTAVAKDDGTMTVTLVSGLSNPYRVTLPDGQTFDIAVPDGASVTLETLRASYSGQIPPLTVVVGPTGPAGGTGPTGPGGGPTGPSGPAGPIGRTGPGNLTMLRTFSTTITDADPGNGFVRLNHATQTSATLIFIDLLDTGGVDQTTLLDSLDDSSSVIKGILRMERAASSTVYLLWQLTAWTTATGYRKLTLTLLDSSSASPFANNDPVILTFVRTGDKGDDGPTGPNGVAGVTGPIGPAGASLIVQEGDGTIDANVLTLDFDAAAFNVSSAPAGEANITLAYGTTPGTPAEGGTTVLKAGDEMTGPLDIDLDSGGDNVSLVAYGSNPGIQSFRSAGTKGAPTATLINTFLAFIGGRGYGTTGFGSQAKALIALLAAEQWTDSAQGTYIALSTTPTGSTTRAEQVRIDHDGDVGIGTTTPAAKLDVAGEIRASTAGTNAASVVTVGGTQTLTNKTLTAPTFSDFTNAQHNHGDANSGGQLTGAAFSSFSINDSILSVQDNADPSKKFGFEASGITTSTVRTYTAPNASGTMALQGQADNLTIATGAVTISGGWITFLTVDTEGAAATDNLATISGGVTAQMLVVRQANDARDVTFQDNVGNLQLAGDFTPGNNDGTLFLAFNGSAWQEVSRSTN